MIKFKLISLVFGLLVLDSYSQTSLLKFEMNTSKYFVDTIEYNQIDFIYSNLSNEYYVLWMDSSNHDSLTTEQRINHFFYTIKGDFYLSKLLYEELVNELPIQLYLSFYKIIRPNDQFTISILLKNSDDIQDEIISNFKKQVVIVKSNDSKRLPSIEDLERFNYKARSITLSGDIIKFNK